jgi:pteridine reductase
MSLAGKNVLITGAARRVGRSLARAVAQAGGNVIIHYGNSSPEAGQLQAEIQASGGTAHLVQGDLSQKDIPANIIEQASAWGPLFALVNNASIFEPVTWDQTGLESWEKHFSVNLTAPFFLSQAFARQIPPGAEGRIVNLLDWRALRPGPDHLPYTISKAALAALTRSLAVALAPRITVNGLAFGAILPPSTGQASKTILDSIPAGRWAELEEPGKALLFLLDGPSYITGEIIHLDGGRHLI